MKHLQNSLKAIQPSSSRTRKQSYERWVLSPQNAKVSPTLMSRQRSLLEHFRLARDPSWGALMAQELRELYRRFHPQEPVPKRPLIPQLRRKQARQR